MLHPFQARYLQCVGRQTTKQGVLWVALKEVKYPLEVLLSACDAQVTTWVNAEMPEDELWYYGIEFYQKWIPYFKKGYKAFVFTYHFVEEKSQTVLQRVKKAIPKEETWAGQR